MGALSNAPANHTIALVPAQQTLVIAHCLSVRQENVIYREDEFFIDTRSVSFTFCTLAQLFTEH